MIKAIRIILILLIAMSLYSCKEADKSGQALAEERKLTAVETLLVGKSDFEKRRVYVGDISVVRKVSVIPLASEQILKFPWENGDFVKEGEVIAEIRNVVSKQGAAQLSAQMRALDVQINAAQREAKRVEGLFASNIVSKQTVDQTKDGVMALQAQRDQLSAAQRQTQLGLQYSTVVAPISGVVSNKILQVGDVAGGGMPLCVLLDLTEMKVTLNVSEEDAPQLKIDQEVALRFDAFPKEVVTAKINRIMPYVNPMTRSNTVEAVFTNIQDKETGQFMYKPGMYAQADVLLSQQKNVIVVPQRSLLMEPELLEKQREGLLLRKVFVLKEDGTVSARHVEIGERSSNEVEILKGLELGERLVVRGHHSLKDGESVRDLSKDKVEIATAGGTQEKGS